MVEARLSPDGFVAQRLTFPGGEVKWILTWASEDELLTVRILEEGEADEWPRLAGEG